MVISFDCYQMVFVFVRNETFARKGVFKFNPYRQQVQLQIVQNDANKSISCGECYIYVGDISRIQTTSLHKFMRNDDMDCYHLRGI